MGHTSNGRQLQTIYYIKEEVRSRYERSSPPDLAGGHVGLGSDIVIGEPFDLLAEARLGVISARAAPPTAEPAETDNNWAETMTNTEVKCCTTR